MNHGRSDIDTGAPAHSPRVLIVHPDRNYLGLLARRLGEAGYRVTTADSGANAVAELNRVRPDLLLAELYMPRIDGADLARIIRGESAWRDLPVMLITSRSRPDGAVRAYQAGADDVILKPFHFEVLFARIARRIARARAIARLHQDNAALDARVVTRAIELRETRERLRASEAERQRLQAMVGRG